MKNVFKSISKQSGLGQAGYSLAKVSNKFGKKLSNLSTATGLRQAGYTLAKGINHAAKTTAQIATGRRVK
jgi:hypothetical protein